MILAILMFIDLMILWLALSGLFKTMLIGLGVVSCALAVYIFVRMDREDGEAFAVGLKPIHLLGYLIWLLKEIALSTLTVTKAIFGDNKNISQKLFSIGASHKTDMGQVVFANSITLTPGTITVEVDEGYFLVHALCYSEAEEQGLCDMGNRVKQLEYGSKSEEM